MNTLDYKEIKEAVYSICDLLLILKTYCQHHKKQNVQMAQVNDIVNELEKKINIISEKF